MSQRKVAYILSHPIQYISPLLKELAAITPLHVYYFSDASIKGNVDKGFGKAVKWDVPMLEGYEYTFVPNRSKKQTLSNKFTELINPGIINELRKGKAQIVIVSGWTYFSVLLTIFTAFLMRKKIWIRAENPLNQELDKSPKTIFLKKMLLKNLLFKMADKLLYIGSENKKFFEFYGGKEHQFIYTPYSVNNSFFQQQYHLYKNSIAELKKELNIDAGKKVILFSGKYIDQKRPLDLLTAFASLDWQNYVLVFVGEGMLRPQMEAYINQHHLQHNVILTGFVNQSVISKYYSTANVFVMCSGKGETWGLSVNEAMNFSLPVIVSQTCGSSYDLVDEGVNGFTFPEGDTATLAKHITRILDDDGYAAVAGRRSLEIINGFAIDKIAHNIAAAAQQL